MPDVWFFIGLAMGTIVTGFCAVGSFDRGSASVRRSWDREHDARNRALVSLSVRDPRGGSAYRRRSALQSELKPPGSGRPLRRPEA